MIPMHCPCQSIPPPVPASAGVGGACHVSRAGSPHNRKAGERLYGRGKVPARFANPYMTQSESPFSEDALPGAFVPNAIISAINACTGDCSKYRMLLDIRQLFNLSKDWLYGTAL